MSEGISLLQLKRAEWRGWDGLLQDAVRLVKAKTSEQEPIWEVLAVCQQ